MCSFEEAMAQSPISIKIDIDPAAMCPQPAGRGSIIDRDHTYDDKPCGPMDIQKMMEKIGMCPVSTGKPEECDPKPPADKPDGKFPSDKELEDKPKFDSDKDDDKKWGK